MSQTGTDTHTETVRAMFGRISSWYDFQNHLFSLGLDIRWRRKLAASVVPGSRGVIADVAAGTLDVTLALCRRYPAIRVIAVDICTEMLNYGLTRKARPDEKNRISALTADARALPLDTESVDAVTMAFGIRNVVPRVEALAEMYRVLAPGGRACILEFSPVTVPVWGRIYHSYLRYVMPYLAGLCNDAAAFRYLAESVEQFPSPRAFCRELGEVGFSVVESTPLALGITNLFLAVKPF